MPSRFTVPAISILEPARDLGQQRSCLIAVENESKPNARRVIFALVQYRWFIIEGPGLLVNFAMYTCEWK